MKPSTFVPLIDLEEPASGSPWRTYIVVESMGKGSQGTIGVK
jgi:hypothetical protein